MILRDVLTAIPEVITPHMAALGLEGVSYPAEPAFPASPWLMVRQSLYTPTQVLKARAGRQVVRAGIDLVVLVQDHGDPAAASRVDGVPEALLDLFDANAVGGDVNHAFAGTSLPGSVDHIWTDALIRRMTLVWYEAGPCHAAIITVNTEFQREATTP